MSQGFDDIETVFERFEKARTLDLIIKQDCEIVSDSARSRTEVAIVVPRYAYVSTWRDQGSRKFPLRLSVFTTHVSTARGLARGTVLSSYGSLGVSRQFLSEIDKGFALWE